MTPLPKSLAEYSLEIVKEASPSKKVCLARRLGSMWRAQEISLGGLASDMPYPDQPGRPDKPELLSLRDMPRRRTGSKKGLIALVHSLAHIELNAIDMAFDLLARFGDSPLPYSFFDEALKVGLEEADHYEMINGDLEILGARYGDLPAHGGLWDAVMTTRHDLLARLAIVPLVLEARGLDVSPMMIERVKASGEDNIVKTMQQIYRDEITHVAFGAKWFKFLCRHQNRDPKTTFHSLVREHFRGLLKPPFNVRARTSAGLPEEFYIQPDQSKS